MVVTLSRLIDLNHLLDHNLSNGLFHNFCVNYLLCAPAYSPQSRVLSRPIVFVALVHVLVLFASLVLHCDERTQLFTNSLQPPLYGFCSAQWRCFIRSEKSMRRRQDASLESGGSDTLRRRIFKPRVT